MFIDRWDRFMDGLESDPCTSRQIMQPDQYMSDVIAYLQICVFETSDWVSICIKDGFSEPGNGADDEGDGREGDGDETGNDDGNTLELTVSHGTELPDDDDYVAKISFARIITNNDAVGMLKRLGLFGKSLYVPDWKPRNPEEVTAYLEGHEDGIIVDGDVITFGSEPLDRESMELLCMLDLLDKPIGGWMEANTGR